MAFLSILGVTIPVADESAARIPERVGDVDTDGPGVPAFVQRGTRRRWEFRTPPIRQELADPLTDLIEGVYHRIDFAGGNTRAGTGLSPLPGYRQFRIVDLGIVPVSTDYFIAWDAQIVEGEWFLAWRDNLNGGQTYGLRSDGTRYLDGAIVDSNASLVRFDVDEAGHVFSTIEPEGALTTIYEALVVPWYPPDGWGEAITSPSQSWAHNPAPVIEAAGDFIEETSVRVVGTVDGADHIQGARDGAWRSSLRELSVVLVEADERLFAPIVVDSTWDDLINAITPPTTDELLVWVDASNIDGVFNETLTDGQEIDYIANLARYRSGAEPGTNFFWEDQQFYFSGTNKAVYRATGGINNGPWIDVPSGCHYSTLARVSSVTQAAESFVVAHDEGNSEIRMVGGVDSLNRQLNYTFGGTHRTFAGTALIGSAYTTNRWHFFYSRWNGLSSIAQLDDVAAVNGDGGLWVSNGWRLFARHDGASANSQRLHVACVYRGDGSLPGQATLKTYANNRFGSGWPKV